MITISLSSSFLTVCHQNNILYGLEYTDITRVVTTSQSTTVRYDTDRKTAQLWVIVYDFSNVCAYSWSFIRIQKGFLVSFSLNYSWKVL